MHSIQSATSWLRLILGFTLSTIPASIMAAPADHLAASISARKQGDTARAIQEATAAIAQHPQSGEAYLERAFAHFAAKNTEAAVKDFKAAVEVDPTNARAYIYRGDLAYRLIEGNYAACESDYAVALKLDPEFPSYRAYTAELYLYLKQPDRVITEAVQGLLAEPHAPIHKINLAHGLAFAGQLESAKAVYRAIATVEIGYGRKGATFALGDFATLQRKGIVYPAMTELTPFLQALAKPAGDTAH